MSMLVAVLAIVMIGAAAYAFRRLDPLVPAPEPADDLRGYEVVEDRRTAQLDGR